MKLCVELLPMNLNMMRYITNEKAAYLNLQDSHFTENEGLYDYSVYVIDTEG